MDVAIDLGTASTLVYAAGRGVLVREPSVVALREGARGEVVCVGTAARRLEGRAPRHLRVVRPLRGGVIVDAEVCVHMLRAFLAAAGGRRISRVLISVPRATTPVERAAFREVAARAAGARRVALIEEPLAAALGADLPVGVAAGSMLVDVGGGITEAVVISLGEIVTSASRRLGGDSVDERIAWHLRARRGFEIGLATAEQLKIALCSEGATAASALAKGRHVASRLPGAVEVRASELHDALAGVVDDIVELAVQTFEELPPELVSDVADAGVVLSGGGSFTRSLAERLARRAGIPVRRAPDPLAAVIHGNGRALSEPSTFA